MILDFLKKYKHELQDFRDRGWELIGAGSCSILRKSSSDLLPEDQVYMSKGLKWEVMRSRLRSCTTTFLGGLAYFCFICFSDFLSNSWLFQTKKEIPSR